MRTVPLGTVTEVALPLHVVSAGMLARQFTPAESQTCFTRARAGAPAALISMAMPPMGNDPLWVALTTTLPSGRHSALRSLCVAKRYASEKAFSPAPREIVPA